MKSPDLMGLFPEPIARYTIWADSWQDRLDQFELENRGLHLYSKNEHVLDTIPELRSMISRCLKDFAENTLAIDDTPIITQSWINRYEYDQSAHEHHHPNSLVSATWYWRIPDDSEAEIQFHKHGQNTHSSWAFKFDRNINTHSPFAVLTNSIRVTQGDLLVWPSYMIHSVPKWPYQEPRCTLSLDSIPASWGSSLYRFSVLERPEVLEREAPRSKNL